MQPDYNKAKKWILGIMAKELPSGLAYHGLEHTTDYVLPAVKMFCQDMGISAGERILVKTAALFHDSGFIKEYRENETISAALAESILPSCGYGPDELQSIIQLILITVMPQQPKNTLDEILCDADLVSLGMPEFFETSMMLRRETETFLQPVALVDWLRTQYNFLKEHRYFTTAARKRLDRVKEKNRNELHQALFQPCMRP